jgi:8-oxo-dGTP pyrophosphatase MutT (NUDIX family)
MQKNTDNYCNNCGKLGHMYHHCKLPITSNGVITFRRNKEGIIEYLLIRRKDTLGHIDFMRGKYSVTNPHYIINMLNQMTIDEKNRLRYDEFDTLWNALWGENTLSSQYKNEECSSRDKFNLLRNGITAIDNTFTLNDLINTSNEHSNWDETEWGFPKGRRNHQESDYDCATREFHEETGYSPRLLHNMQNIIPYEEIFTGSNYKSYKHKYYIMFMNYGDSLVQNPFEETEVSKMEWKTYAECVASVRPYNREKIQMLDKINKTLLTLTIL